jgi:hypothetical protein
VLMMLSSVVLAVLLVIGGVEQNPGLVAEGEMAMQLLCTGCGRNVKSRIQCELCRCWYHLLRKCEGYCDRERSGVVISVGLKDFRGCRRNCKMRCDKLMS